MNNNKLETVLTYGEVVAELKAARESLQVLAQGSSSNALRLVRQALIDSGLIDCEGKISCSVKRSEKVDEFLSGFDNQYGSNQRLKK